MKKNKFKNIIGLTLVEILIGIVVSMLMMGAMYTSYSIVNNTYSQVTSRATISRAGRDVVGMMMRDIRMAGYKFYGDNLFYVPGDTAGTLEKSHAPVIITKEGDSFPIHKDPVGSGKKESDDKCCDQIDIVYGDYDFDAAPENQFLRYKITYYAKGYGDPGNDDIIPYYAIYKSKKKWNENDWEVCDDECFGDVLVRDYLVDMEFIATDHNGKVIDPPPSPTNSNSDKLFSIRTVDVRLTFKSKQEFFKSKAEEDEPRLMQGLGNRSREFIDKYLRESILVSIHTRNIGGM